MTLYKQLAAGIILLFIICFSGTVYISTGNLKHFLATQLNTHAQDTATSLGLSISPHIQANDMAVVETMIEAIFARGDYQRILLQTTGGETLVDRSIDSIDRGAPQWFVDMVALQAPVAEALVMAGWKQAGSIQVTSNPGNAHRELWLNTIDTFWLFLACAAALLGGGLLTLRLMLQPLRNVELQASAICNSNYEVQAALPRTRELRRVVLAMNRLSEKVGTFFSEQSATTEKFRELAFRDPVTGLGNRRYFNRQMNALLSQGDRPTTGALLVLELRDLSRVNEKSGFVTGDAALKRMAELLNAQILDLDNCFAARISGAGFGIAATGFSSSSADALAATLCREMLQLRADGLVDCNEIGHIGIAMWEESTPLPALLSEADMALRAAQNSGHNTWQRYSPPAANQSEIYGTEQWRARLRIVLDSGEMMLDYQPVYGSGEHDRKILHHEILSRIPDTRGNGIAASIYMPMAERLGLASQLDKLSATALFGYLQRQEDTVKYALNLSAGALHDAVFLQWFCSQLEQQPQVTGRLLVEFPEYAALINLHNVRALTERLDAMGCTCGIDHFGGGFHSFGYLRNLKISYLKIDGSYTRNIDTDDDNRFFVQALTDTAHGIDIRVIGQSVATPAERDTLEGLHVDGMQGYLLGRPAALTGRDRRTG